MMETDQTDPSNREQHHVLFMSCSVEKLCRKSQANNFYNSIFPSEVCLEQYFIEIKTCFII